MNEFDNIFIYGMIKIYAMVLLLRWFYGLC